MREHATQICKILVRILTVYSLHRRKSGGCSGFARNGRGPARFWLRLTAALFATYTIASSHLVSAAEWQSTTSITNFAESYIRDHYGSTDRRLDAKAAPLDERLRLHQCDGALQAFVRDGTKMNGRAVVGVRCTSPKPWKVYIPVELIVTESVLVAKKTLPKGHQLTASDVVLEQRDVSRMHGGYLSDISEFDGYKLKHQIDGGRVLAPSMLTAQILVRRGQSVTLVVNGDQISISMAGKALSDRARNQRIRVENLKSGRIVEGIVRSAEHVEVIGALSCASLRITP